MIRNTSPASPQDVHATQVHMGSLSPFDLHVAINGITDREIPVDPQHIHDACEIYLNLSGDVSFLVDDTVYPIRPGSVIVTRPLEAHHCIHHSSARHHHYWLLFSAHGNEPYLDLFFQRPKGHGNLISLTEAQTETFQALCSRMTAADCPAFGKYAAFFSLLELLSQGRRSTTDDSHVRPEIRESLRTIHENPAAAPPVAALAQAANMSLSTFERSFRQSVGMTPAKYIRSRRLALARAYLAEGCPVMEASEKSGFPDCSHFIATFKEAYGMTPLKYQKQLD